MPSSKSRERLCLICHITLGFFFLFGVDVSVTMISVCCFQQTCSWNESVISVQPMPPSTAALPAWSKWQSPQHCHTPSISHIMPWMCLFCLRPCAAISPRHRSGGKYQARQTCRCEPPPTCLSGSGQPWGHLLCKAWKTEKKSSIAGIPCPFSAKITHAGRSREFPSRDATLSQA